MSGYKTVKKNQRLFFITGGGTGGHIYPAAAIADSLRSRGHKIIYVGNSKNMEKEIAEKEGFDFLDVDITGMPRHMGFDLLKWCCKLLSATLKSIYYILRYRPDMIFGTGGYVSAPALFAGILTRTPFAIHDCDAVPGIVSRTAAPFAKFVSTAFADSKNYLKSDNVIFNGNPVRTDFQRYNKTTAREKFGLSEKLTILVTGGSQGAKTINKALIESLKKLFASNDLQIIHQTGRKNFEKAVELLNEVYPEYKENPNYIVKPYFDEMYIPLIASDIAVSRAGSLSISEICSAGVAPILIPYPYAAADHQRKNAKAMENLNSAIYIEDDECSAENLTETLVNLIENPSLLNQLQENVQSLAKPDAVEKITEEILEFVK